MREKPSETFSSSASLQRFDSEGCVGISSGELNSFYHVKTPLDSRYTLYYELLHWWSPTLDFFRKKFFFKFYHRIACNDFLDGFYMRLETISSHFSETFSLSASLDCFDSEGCVEDLVW